VGGGGAALDNSVAILGEKLIAPPPSYDTMQFASASISGGLFYWMAFSRFLHLIGLTRRDGGFAACLRGDCIDCDHSSGLYVFFNGICISLSVVIATLCSAGGINYGFIRDKFSSEHGK
jgi:hypothetical protein